MSETPGPHDASPAGMPPDPFTPADAAYALIYAEFAGLRKAGAGIVEAAVITAAHIIVTRALDQGQPPAGQQSA